MKTKTIEVSPFTVTYIVTHAYTGETIEADTIPEALFHAKGLFNGVRVDYRDSNIINHFSGTPKKNTSDWVYYAAERKYRHDIGVWTFVPSNTPIVDVKSRCLSMKDSTGRFIPVDELRQYKPFNPNHKSKHQRWYDWNHRRTLHGKRLVKTGNDGTKIKAAWQSIEYIDSHGEVDYKSPIHYFRSIRTHQEIRTAVSHVDEYGEHLIRGKRRASSLPTSWDDVKTSYWDCRKSWKHHSKRRKQWKPL